MDYYSAIIKNEILPSAITCVGLEINTLSGVIPTEKDKCHMNKQTKQKQTHR